MNKNVLALRIVAEGKGACCLLEVETISGQDKPFAREKNRRV